MTDNLKEIVVNVLRGKGESLEAELCQQGIRNHGFHPEYGTGSAYGTGRTDREIRNRMAGMRIGHIYWANYHSPLRIGG
jgi:hypothetical protein